MDPQIHAALIGGAFVAGSVGIGWWVSIRDRAAQRRDAELAEVEAAAWELLATASRFSVVAPALFGHSKAWRKSPNTFDAIGRSLADVTGPTARAYGRIKARSGRFPDLAARCRSRRCWCPCRHAGRARCG